MKFTEEHEWLRTEGDIVVVGITEHASTQLGDVVFVELPEEGITVSKDDEIVVIESVKAASDILAPLDGEIIATENSKEAIGKITSGGYGPTVGYPIAMGYINSEYANSEDDLFGELRGKRVPVKVAKIPFVPLNFKR